MNKKRKARKAMQIWYFYFWKNDYQKAVSNFLRAIWFKNSKQSLEETLYHDIAYCYENIDDFKNAEYYIKRCLEISPWYLNGKIFLWNLYVHMWKKEKWEQILKECDKEVEKIKNTSLDLDVFYNSK